MTTQGHGRLPGWGMSSIPWPPPRQHEHERRYTSSTHQFILTRRIWKDDYDDHMIFRDFMGLKLPDIGLAGEENPRKKPHPGNFSLTGIEPGPTAWQAHKLPPTQQCWTFYFLTGRIAPVFYDCMYVCILGCKGASTSQVIGARNETMMDDYDGQMIFGDLMGLKLPDIRLTGEENPDKTSPSKLVPTGDRTWARCVTSAHATTCSTAVNSFMTVLVINTRLMNLLIHDFIIICYD